MSKKSIFTEITFWTHESCLFLHFNTNVSCLFTFFASMMFAIKTNDDLEFLDKKWVFRIVCYSPSVDRTSAIIILKRAVVGVQCSVASTQLFAHSHSNSSVLRLFECRIDTSWTHGHLLFPGTFFTLPNIAQSPGLFFAGRWRCCCKKTLFLKFIF